MIVNLVWPRTAYDLEGDSSLLQRGAIITIGMNLAFGGAQRWWRRRTHAAIVIAPIPITITAKLRGADAETRRAAFDDARGLVGAPRDRRAAVALSIRASAGERLRHRRERAR